LVTGIVGPVRQTAKLRILQDMGKDASARFSPVDALRQFHG
jgi:hypothetical protein